MKAKWRTGMLKTIHWLIGQGRVWRNRSLFTLGAALLVAAVGPASADEALAWKALRAGGHVAALRHAIAPGTGDPSNFSLDDCATQRNLSERGRARASRIGARFRENGIQTARVFSSQWCRCKETAGLLGLGTVQELPALNSFFETPQNRGPQMEKLGTWLKQRDVSVPLVLVTHQVNITALTGIYPRSGEIVVVRPSAAGRVKVIGTITTEY